MLEFNDLTLRRGARDLIHGASLSVHDGQKVGIVGPNGTGKSSLFALIRGELTPEGGHFRLPRDWRIAWVAQETPDTARPAIEYVLDGDEELRDLEAQLEAAEAEGDGLKLGELHGRMGAIDAYTARSRAARLMRGLGFGGADESCPVNRFSGGWRVRLNLARALMCRSDLLLLDEPTNHLDLDAVLWLQDFLVSYTGTLLIISHDRDFLDAVVGHIVHMAGGTLRLYDGNYSHFEAKQAAERARQQAAYEKQQKEKARIHSFVERFRANAAKARQAQSRLKALERMEEVAPAHADSPFQFSFPAPEKLPAPLMSLKKVSAGYGDQPILRGVSLGLHPGDRLGLLGPNGAGKSTLIKLLGGDLDPMDGTREPAQGLRVGYFAQHSLERLDPGASPMDHLHELDPGAAPQDLRDYIGGFGFQGDMALSPCGPFSGGEKARLALALLVYQRPNLLLLDEPTNHLDLEMRHALTVALQDFAGALVVVSHDRHLMRSVTDRLLLVSDGGADDFAGDLADYGAWLRERNREEATADAGGDGKSDSDAKQRRKQSAARRQELKPLRQEIRQLEKTIDKLSQRKQTLDEQLGDPGLYDEGQKARLQELLREQGQVEKDLAEAEEAWLEASERLEAAMAET